MKKPKGGIDEKCPRVAEWMRNHAEPYTQKELEKLLPKNISGVNFQQVNEILEILVSEGLVASEKIGILNLFWAVSKDTSKEAKAASGKRARPCVINTVENVTARINELALESEELEKSIVSMQNGLNAANKILLDLPENIQVSSATVEEKKEKYSLLEKRLEREVQPTLRKLLQDYDTVKLHDPQLLAEIEQRTAQCRDSVNRWTDNMMLLAQHIQARCGLTYDEFREQFNVPRDFDYIMASDP